MGQVTEGNGADPGPVCECGHPHDPHPVVSLFTDVREGGLIFCQDRDCDCIHTWSAPDWPVPEMPSPAELAAIKREILG